MKKIAKEKLDEVNREYQVIKKKDIESQFAYLRSFAMKTNRDDNKAKKTELENIIRREKIKQFLAGTTMPNVSISLKYWKGNRMKPSEKR